LTNYLKLDKTTKQKEELIKRSFNNSRQNKRQN